MSSPSQSSSNVCGECGVLNPRSQSSCAVCGGVLSSNLLETERLSNDVDSDVVCVECAAKNPAGYRFCENCGRSLEAGAQQAVEASPDSPTREVPPPPPLSNRIQLRLVLLTSGVTLVLLAVLAAVLIGVQWAVAPFVVGGISFVGALGRMSSKSLSLFGSDLRTAFAGSPYAGQDAVSTGMEEEPEQASRTAPAAALTSPPMSRPPNEETFAGIETRVPAAPLGRRLDEDVPVRVERHIGAVALTAGLLLSAVSLYMFPKGPPYTVAWWSYGLAVALTLGAVPAFEGGWSALVAKFRHGYRVSFETRKLLPWLGLGVILMLALAIRLYNLDVFPPGLWFDEADNIDQARFIAENPGQTPLYVPSNNLPSFFLLPIAIVVKYAGVSMTTGRLVAVAFGVAGVAAAFLLVRHMSGTAMGLVAAFLTAVMRWDIVWSRIGMHGITAPFFAALTAWLTFRALDRGRAMDFALPERRWDLECGSIRRSACSCSWLRLRCFTLSLRDGRIERSSWET